MATTSKALEQKLTKLQATLTKLEKRNAILEEIEAIRQVRAKYAYFLAEGDVDQLMGLFTDDVVTEYPYGSFHGKEALEGFFKALRVLPVNMGHSPIIRVDGKRAFGQWFYFGAVVSSAKAAFLMGRYDEEYVKQNGNWRISKLVTSQIRGPIVDVASHSIPRSIGGKQA